MTDRNQFGLQRKPGRPLRREIRQRCGFGCVYCGLAFFDYEHFDPDFKDAREHRAEGMTLLCCQCNQKRRRGLLSRETVAAANANPLCKQKGFANESFDFGSESLSVTFGSNVITNCAVLIELDNYPLLSIQAPEHEGQSFRLSGLFADADGQTTLKIEENELYVGADNWDVECEGRTITVRSGPGNISLVLTLQPPTGLTIERLNMFYEGLHLRGDAVNFEYSWDGNHWIRHSDCQIKEFGVAFSFRSNRVER